MMLLNKCITILQLKNAKSKKNLLKCHWTMNVKISSKWWWREAYTQNASSKDAQEKRKTYFFSTNFITPISLPCYFVRVKKQNMSFTYCLLSTSIAFIQDMIPFNFESFNDYNVAKTYVFYDYRNIKQWILQKSFHFLLD